MKKFISILTICVVSLNFVSCRQDDDAEVTSVNMTEKTVSYNKSGDSAVTDSTRAIVAKPAPVDPDPPVRDGTSW
ncbi:MAG: hypothetical protein DI529_09400 [Chryseobacterium sp.]|nr:MAG: hypothetical protein DI529_09400 [Chryseobacterium sp.]